MAKDYSISGTTKLQREKYVNDALALTVLGAPEPTPETRALMQEYIDGKREIADILKATVARYKVTPHA
jgi:hypothetical protein